jgi:acyl-CoA thioesterase I
MRVLIFGDSITQGFWDVDGGWVNRLRKHYDQKMINRTDDPPTVFNLGVSGDSSAEVLARFDNETKARSKEDLTFVIAIGVNDARTKAGVNFSDTNQYRQNLEGILQLARKYSDKIMFVGLTPCVEDRTNPVGWGSTGYTNTRIREVDTALREFCEANHLPFVEIFEPFNLAQSSTELLPDGLHPNAAGHKLIADIVLPELEKLLA